MGSTGSSTDELLLNTVVQCEAQRETSFYTQIFIEAANKNVIKLFRITVYPKYTYF